MTKSARRAWASAAVGGGWRSPNETSTSRFCFSYRFSKGASKVRANVQLTYFIEEEIEVGQSFQHGGIAAIAAVGAGRIEVEGWGVALGTLHWSPPVGDFVIGDRFSDYR